MSQQICFQLRFWDVQYMYAPWIINIHLFATKILFDKTGGIDSLIFEIQNSIDMFVFASIQKLAFMQTHEKETAHGHIQRGGAGAAGPVPHPPENHPKKGFLEYWSGSPLNHKATKPAFDVGPSVAHQQNSI